MDQATLELVSRQHPAWQLLRARHAPLIASFLHEAFVVPNVRSIPQGDLVEALEDRFYELRQDADDDSYPRPAQDYLNEWSASERGWLRRFYPEGSDEPHFDLTPATEKAIAWIAGLTEREFVGTESRLLTLFDLLEQMSVGSETDPVARIRDLERQRERIEEQIDRIRRGDVPVLDDTAVRERFQQFQAMARELLADFREVEHNFRLLDRRMRERIALWDGSKGALLDRVMSEHDVIADSDQGKSFRAFWAFLMSQERQELLEERLETVLALPAVAATRPDPRLRRVHHDWIESGEHTQRTVARLSQQLRRFLDDQAWIENRRILEILKRVEAHAVALRDAPPQGDVMDVDRLAASVELPMERRLFAPPVRPVIADVPLRTGDEDVDASDLFRQAIVDKNELLTRVLRSLRERPQVTLRDLADAHPLRHGLAELITYLQIAGERAETLVVEETVEPVEWTAPSGTVRRAALPRIVFVRSAR